jgi:hypothetical protein
VKTKSTSVRKELRPEEWERLNAVLRPFLAEYPEADVDAYRRNLHSMRIRVVHPVFKNMDRVNRDEFMWKYLDKLPKRLHQDITMLLVLSPDEQDKSFMNHDYENPLPSSLV